MEYVDFYNDYISDLSKIKYVVSKEDDTILTGKVFTDNIDVDGNEDIYNLNTKNDDDAFYNSLYRASMVRVYRFYG